MPGQSRALAQAYAARREQAASSVATNRALAAGVVFATTAIAYGAPGASHLVFFSALVLFLLQIFASAQQSRLFALSRAFRSARGGLPAERLEGARFAGAALAVRDAYFVLFLCFDVSWLLFDFVRPSTAGSFAEYVARLRIGPLSGTGLLVFTVVFWLGYAALLAYGWSIARDVCESGADPAAAAKLAPQLEPLAVERIPFAAEVKIWEGTRIKLNGFRLPQTKAAQALILWPGFTQNGFVFDLFPGAGNLAEYLWRRGFDVWVFHTRGTGASGGRGYRASLDDFAAFDLPAAIRFVSAKIDAPPVFVGHSMGGICALLSAMGLERLPAGPTRLSDDAAAQRQQTLAGLVTLGSLPDFTFARESGLQRFVRRGIELRLLGKRLYLPVTKLLPLLRGFTFLGIPVGLRLRQALARGGALGALLAPLYLLLEFAAQLRLWEFLYHRPNVSRSARRQLFFATVDGTFWDVVQQYRQAVLRGRMLSSDERVDCSENYARIRLPTCLVAMELDSLADPQRMRTDLLDRLGSARKSYVVWPGVGHEDFFMDPKYFPRVEEAIRAVLGELPSPG